MALPIFRDRTKWMVPLTTQSIGFCVFCSFIFKKNVYFFEHSVNFLLKKSNFMNLGVMRGRILLPNWLLWASLNSSSFQRLDPVY